MKRYRFFDKLDTTEAEKIINEWTLKYDSVRLFQVIPTTEYNHTLNITKTRYTIILEFEKGE